MRMLRPDGHDRDPRRRQPKAEPALAAAPRRRRRLGLPILTAALLAPAAMAFGAAWTLPRGTGQAIVTTTYTQGTRYMRPDGAAQRLPEYRKAETSALVQYGLTDDVTLIAMPSLLGARTGGATADDYLGLGHTDLGARARIWHDGQGVIALQALGRLPGAGDDRRPAQLGNTDAQLDLRLLLGRGFTVQEMNGWMNAEAAYRARFGDAPNEWRFDLTLGLRPSPAWAVLAQSFTVVTDGEGRGAYPSSWYTKAQLSLLYEVAPSWTLQAGAFTTLAGENALREHGALVALWRSF
ncbi:hypothetical protein [Falsiroseomonas sp. CW058]|uniref:hypothetical protein n=1 Tax=Falsiroseomonas sp. CW058 TaxID=3388664 RepID=UPI003D31C4A6